MADSIYETVTAFRSRFMDRVYATEAEARSDDIERAANRIRDNSFDWMMGLVESGDVATLNRFIIAATILRDVAEAEVLAKAEG